MVAHTCSLIAYVGSRRWCSGSSRPRESHSPSGIAEKLPASKRRRTSSSPAIPSNFALLVVAVALLAENVSIRKLAFRGKEEGVETYSVVHRATVYFATRRDVGGRDSVREKVRQTRKSRNCERQLSLTTIPKVVSSRA